MTNAKMESYSEEQVPAYWKGNNQDVENVIRDIKKGKVHRLRDSAGGRPIYMIEYGSSNMPPSQATLSSALGAGDYTYYANKSGADYHPTVFLAGCIHGGEFEGTVALLNLIHMMEKGADYAGNTDQELLCLVENLHLVLIPIANPDGRSHIPFDNFVGKTFYDLRYYNQGTWKDGSLCGYPQCKKYFPIKDYVDYLGGYYNDDGVNMMHDDFFGQAAAETRNILDVCRLYAPDVSVLFHGAAGYRSHITVPAYVSGAVKTQICDLIKRTICAYAMKDVGLVDNRKEHLSNQAENANPPKAFNLVSAMHHCCGEMCITFESNQGLTDNGHAWNNEQIYFSHMIFMRCIFEMVTEDR